MTTDPIQTARKLGFTPDNVVAAIDRLTTDPKYHLSGLCHAFDPDLTTYDNATGWFEDSYRLVPTMLREFGGNSLDGYYWPQPILSTPDKRATRVQSHQERLLFLAFLHTWLKDRP